MTRNRNRPNHSRIRLGAASLLALAGCGADSITGPVAERDEGAPVQTDRLDYEVSAFWMGGSTTVTLTLTMTYTNDGEAPRYLGTCGEAGLAVVLEKQTSRHAWTAMDPGCDRILSPPVEVGPGEQHTESVSLQGFLGPPGDPRFPWPIDGVYRVRIFPYPHWIPGNPPDPADLVPLVERVSNRFSLRPPEG